MGVSKNIKFLSWFNFFTDFKLYAPFAIIYFSKVTGSFALGMAVFSVAMISSALFETPTGIYSDLIGRKKTIVFGAAAAVLYSLFYAIGQSFWILVVGAVFEGLSRSFYSGNNDALLYDTLSETKTESRYSEVLGKTSAMFQLALAISAVIGGFLASWSFPFIMWFSVIPQIFCFLISLYFVEPAVKTEKSGNVYQHLQQAVENFKKNKKLRMLSISSISGYAFGEAAYNFQSAFYNMLWPVWAIGLAKTLSNFGATVSFYYGGKIIKKFGAIQTVIADNLYNRVVNIAMTAVPNILSPFFMSTTSFFYGATSVAKSHLLQKEFKDAQRATMGSLNSFAGSIMFGILAIILGYVADKITPAKALLVLNLFQIVNLYLYWKVFKNDKK